MRKSGYYSSLGVCLALLFLIFPFQYSTNAQQAALVIEGGTLIDGNGGAAVPDSVIVDRKSTRLNSSH